MEMGVRAAGVPVILALALWVLSGAVSAQSLAEQKRLQDRVIIEMKQEAADIAAQGQRFVCATAGGFMVHKERIFRLSRFDLSDTGTRTADALYDALAANRSQSLRRTNQILAFSFDNRYHELDLSEKKVFVRNHNGKIDAHDCELMPPLRPANLPVSVEQLLMPSPQAINVVQASSLRIKHCPKPVYPALSRRLGEQGRTVVELRVNRDGQVLSTRVIESSGSSRLDQAALATASACTLEPMELRGQEWSTNMPFVWRLSD